MPNHQSQSLPLAGLRVIELSHMVMGPGAGVILADLGADVVKIEPLGGDKTRRLKGSGAGYFPMYNRNKRSLCVDIRTPSGLALLRRLVLGADVFLENFRPGAMARQGLDYPSLAAEHPGLIYCSLKGFLQGPYAHRAALDETVQMMGGLAYMTGLPGQPLRAGASVVDVIGGMFGVISVLAALEERRRSGRGQQVQSGLFESVAFLVGQHMAQQAVTGEEPPPMSVRQAAWSVYDIFDTLDGEQVFVGVVSDGQWRKLCDAFGFDDWASDEGFKENNGRCQRREQILPRLSERFAALRSADLMAELDAIGLPFSPIQKPGDLFEDVHLNASGGLLDMHLPDGSRRALRLPALPVTLDGERLGLRRDLPAAGEQSREVLAEAGLDADEIDRLIADGVVGLPDTSGFSAAVS